MDWRTDKGNPMLSKIREAGGAQRVVVRVDDGDGSAVSCVKDSITNPQRRAHRQAFPADVCGVDCGTSQHIQSNIALARIRNLLRACVGRTGHDGLRCAVVVGRAGLEGQRPAWSGPPICRLLHVVVPTKGRWCGWTRCWRGVVVRRSV